LRLVLHCGTESQATDTYTSRRTEPSPLPEYRFIRNLATWLLDTPAQGKFWQCMMRLADNAEQMRTTYFKYRALDEWRKR